VIEENTATTWDRVHRVLAVWFLLGHFEGGALRRGYARYQSGRTRKPEGSPLYSLQPARISISMRLNEALQIAGQSGGVRKRDIHLLCGFTPLHLQTYVKAYLKLRFPEDSIQVNQGLYGDLEGNLDRALDQSADGAIVVIEWTDLDQRLGFRGTGGWRTQTIDDIVAQAKEKCARLEIKIEALVQKFPLTLISPTLPLPPLTQNSPVQSSKFELRLNSIVEEFLLTVSECRGVRLVSASHLAGASPHHTRHDVKMELATGFPYSLSHTDELAGLGVSCLFPNEPKKGLITDLDQTLWKGILGDLGVEGVSWSVEAKSQVHALYQQLLDSLAESGVLVAIASKNDFTLVDQALRRPDLLIHQDAIYPVDVSWGPKSQSVGRILKAWNIGAESVVFIDDSEMELSEVSEKFPQIECLLFPSSDSAGVLTLLERIRELFGKAQVREEDRLRVASLRGTAQLQSEAADAGSMEFIARLKARVTFEAVDGNQERTLELVNKTNQFNLNGVRFTESEWLTRLSRPASFLTIISYEDRFGPLGRIAVLGGYFQDGRCIVDIFVMSCRAFSRLIEYQVISQLFERSGFESVIFAFKPTERNGPMQACLGQFNSLDNSGTSGIEVSSEAFVKACPKLHHEVIEKWTMLRAEKNC
jgi:FkbH-like protein